MECASCNTSLPDDALFCLRCGTRAPYLPAEPSDPLREALKTALGRQYEVSRLLGKGGMGAVYLALETALEREVAIKVLPPDRGATQDSRDRFRREARTAAKLSHPNIVPLHSFGDVNGTLYFVMGYVKGESLGRRLKREGTLAPEEARQVLIEVADALDYAHKLGIVHRDIKPDNVLIEEGTGRALLTDFGVAKALGVGQTMTEIGSVLGTPQYMSPEQAQGKPDIDHRADIYSLGVMGYAMLAGRLPFEGATLAEVMTQHITKEAPRLASLTSSVPPELTSALMRCLAKNPEQRFQDASSLRTALAPAGKEETPEEFDGLALIFRSIMGAGLAALLLAAWWFGVSLFRNQSPRLPLAALGFSALFAVILAEKYWRLRRGGFESFRIVKEMFKQPEAWPGWYPRLFRLPGDVWDRLPPQLRWARASVGWTTLLALLGGLPLLVFVISVFFGSVGPRPANNGDDGPPDSKQAAPVRSPFPIWSVILPMLGIAPLLMFRWRILARSRGLDPRIASRAIFVSTSRRAFWSKPEIAALLLPLKMESGESSTAKPTTTSGLVDAVRVIVSTLPEPAQAVGAQAQAAARNVADSIVALDKQIANLARALDPDEARRVVDRLAALGPDLGPTDENREVREILQKKLDPVRSLEARLEDAKARRAKRFELLRALWVHAIDLQRASGDDNATEGAINLVRKHIAHIDEQSAGSRTPGDPGSVAEAISESPTLER